jgi:hypothetical protein
VPRQVFANGGGDRLQIARHTVGPLHFAPYLLVGRGHRFATDAADDITQQRDDRQRRRRREAVLQQIEAGAEDRQVAHA